VLKNVLAYELSRDLKAAGAALEAGEITQALALVRDFHTRLEGLRHAVLGLYNDHDVGADIAMLAEYKLLLASAAPSQPTVRDHIAASLRFSGFLKVLPRPERE
jgi:hypothetical protein